MDKKHYFQVQEFFYKDILSLDRQYVGNNRGIRVLNCIVAMLEWKYYL
jgi:hypothetical protein